MTAILPTERGPSQHLTWEEMACSDGTPYPEEWRMTRAIVLARTFERIRTRLGKISGKTRPIKVSSCYRTPEFNAGLKPRAGARDSMHLYGLAIDLHTPKGCTLEQLVKAANDTITSTRGAICVYPWGIHVDRRDYLSRPPVRKDFRTEGAS